jgi:hypothetical protein
MTKEEIIEVAEDLFDSNEEPEWEVDLLDQFASVFCDVTAEGKCLVVFANNLNGEIEDAKMFDTAEEAEAHLNALQNEAYEPEEEIDV